MESNDKRDSLERQLIEFVAPKLFNNSFDELAKEVSSRTGKSINGRKFVFYAKGDNFAKKWVVECLLELAFEAGWRPKTIFQWNHLAWTLFGKRTSVFGGDQEELITKITERFSISADSLIESLELAKQESISQSL